MVAVGVGVGSNEAELLGKAEVTSVKLLAVGEVSKAISDPLQIKLSEAFAGAPGTSSQHT